MNEFALHLQKDAPEPLFEQLYAYIKNEIVNGHILPQEKLPSKRQLAESLRCSQNTVQAAYNQLTDEGYLIARARSGYYAAVLDGVLAQASSRAIPSGDQPAAAPYAYELSYQGVDDGSFPFTLWRKLTREVINDYDRDLLRTGEANGHPGLRTGIARYLHHSRGVRCRPEQIIISSGTEFLLQLLIQLFNADTVYAIENPGYEKLGMIFGANRSAYTPVPLDEYGMVPEKLEETGADVAIVTPSHQFPTGRIMTVSRRIRMLNWAYEKPERYIVEDDYDSEFRYSGKPIPSLQGLDRQGKVIYIGAFSKSLSPALRISYMVLPEALARRYQERLHFYICPVPTIEQKTLQRFIDDGHFERHLNRVRNLYRQKRELLTAALREAFPNAEIAGASAGLHFTLRLAGASEAALIKAAKAQDVKVYGLSRYYSVPAADEPGGTLLIGFATLKLQDIPNAVARLKKAWS